MTVNCNIFVTYDFDKISSYCERRKEILSLRVRTHYYPLVAMAAVR